MRKLVSTLMTVTLMLVSVTACAERITPLFLNVVFYPIQIIE